MPSEKPKQQTSTDKPPAKRRRDPLGKLQNRYEVTLAGVLIITGAIAVIGGGVLTWGLVKSSLTFQIIGGAIVLIAVVLLAINILQVGRRLEVRRKGLRYSERGVTTELAWEEIVDLNVNRTDDTYLGAVSVVERSNDERRPAGLLTKTELEVTIRGADGDTIHLSRGFLRLIPKPKDLITEIRMRANLGE